jgi:hypothetical protein
MLGLLVPGVGMGGGYSFTPPIYRKATQVHTGGSVKHQSHTGGSVARQVHVGGSQTSQVAR